MPSRPYTPTDVLTSNELGKELEDILTQLELLSQHLATVGRNQEAHYVATVIRLLDSNIYPW